MVDTMLSIVIATKNRSELLIRQLLYYYKLDFQGCICIGDSSDQFHVEQTKRTIQALEHKLRIVYKEYPGLSVYECHRQLGELITTPYMVCVADAGFLVPRSLYKCVEFLERHPDYCIAHGLCALFTLDEDGAYSSFTGVGPYRLPVLEQETASQRLISHLSDYSVTMYCVMHTKIWQAIWKDTTFIKNPSIAGEFLPCCLSVLFGKVKQLDCLYLLRHMHSQRTRLPEIYEWITSPDWQKSFQIFHDTLRDALMEKEGISQEAASKVVRESFEKYLMNCLVSKHRNQIQLRFARIKQFAKQILGLKQAYLGTRYRMPIFRSEFSLERLLSESSSYHEDFMPVYRAITNHLLD